MDDVVSGAPEYDVVTAGDFGCCVSACRGRVSVPVDGVVACTTIDDVVPADVPGAGKASESS